MYVSMHVMDSNFTYRNVVCTSPCMVAIALIAQNVARDKYRKLLSVSYSSYACAICFSET